MATHLQLNNKRTDLGITFQDDLQFTKHLADKVKKANSMIDLIHRRFHYIDNEMLILLYLYISTRLSSIHTWSMPYASSIWSPFKLIEGVQSRATRLSKYLRNEPYNIRLSTLGQPTLQFRRDRADMLQVFRIMNGYEDIDSSRFSSLSSTGLRDHSLFLFQYSAGLF